MFLDPGDILVPWPLADDALALSDEAAAGTVLVDDFGLVVLLVDAEELLAPCGDGIDFQDFDDAVESNARN